MLSSKLGRKRAFLIRIMNSPLRLKAIEDAAIEEIIKPLWLDSLNKGNELPFDKQSQGHQ
jgi:hypothetical protein